jgi:hypothetical protein
MPFDLSKFERVKTESRTMDVRVEGLAEFFGDGEIPSFTVRGLTYSELAAADGAVERAKSVDIVAKAIGIDSAKTEAVKEALGIHGGHPEQMIRRIHFLTVGSVEPKITETVAVMISERHPVEFIELTNSIVELTGRGKVTVKK